MQKGKISVVAQRLIKNDSVIYFLNNYRLIYESSRPFVCSKNGTEKSVIAFFDTVIYRSSHDFTTLFLTLDCPVFDCAT